MIVGPLDEFMNMDSVFANGDVSRMLIDPCAAIEVVNAMLWIVFVQGGVGVTAKNAGCLVMAGMGERALGNFFRQPLPARAQSVEETGDGFVLRIPLLHLQVEQRPDQITDMNIAYDEAVELVTVDCDVAQALIFPLILLVHANADQMGHDLGQAVVVIAFDPNDFNFAFGIGELADEAEKFPVLFFQASEIKVGKDVAEQNKAAILIFAEDAQSFASAAHVRAEVQIREDQRVVNRRRHDFYFRGIVLRGDELGNQLGPGGNV